MARSACARSSASPTSANHDVDCHGSRAVGVVRGRLVRRRGQRHPQARQGRRAAQIGTRRLELRRDRDRAASSRRYPRSTGRRRASCRSRPAAPSRSRGRLARPRRIPARPLRSSTMARRRPKFPRWRRCQGLMAPGWSSASATGDLTSRTRTSGKPTALRGFSVCGISADARDRCRPSRSTTGAC